MESLLWKSSCLFFWRVQKSLCFYGCGDSDPKDVREELIDFLLVYENCTREEAEREINEEIRAEREKGRSLEEIYKEIEEGLAKEKARRGK